MKEPKTKEKETAAKKPDETAAKKPDVARLLLRVAELNLRALTETPLVHGLPIYDDAVGLLAKVRELKEAHE